MFRFLRNRFRPTLAFKLGFLVLISTGLIFFTGFGYYSRVVRRHMLEAVEDFRGVPHRLELVRELNGVRWYNNSMISFRNRIKPTVAGNVRQAARRRLPDTVSLSFCSWFWAAWTETAASVDVAMATPKSPIGSCITRKA